MTIMIPDPPGTTFYRAVAEAPIPVRADRSADGVLSTRAARYCDAVTLASSYGWWVFPPMTIELMWDGRAVAWRYGEIESWLPLDPAAQFPGFAQKFDDAVPDDIRGFSPPFLTALAEPGHVQIWSGFFARTAPQWSLLVRAPANLPLSGYFEAYEGIVEYDRWFGPLFSNLRLTKTHSPIKLDTAAPLLQVQPVHRTIYSDRTMAAMTVVNQLTTFSDGDWADYRRDIICPNQHKNQLPGGYATATRQRRKREQV